MEKYNGIRVRYSHPSVPPSNINVGWIYKIGINKHGLYIDDGNLEQAIDLETLQCLFTPIDTSWQELMREKIEIKETKNKVVDKTINKVAE